MSLNDMNNEELVLLKQLHAMGIIRDLPSALFGNIVMDFSPKPQHTKLEEILLPNGHVDCHVWIVMYENGEKRTYDYSKDTMLRSKFMQCSPYYEGERTRLFKKQFPAELQEELKPYLTRLYKDKKKKCEDAFHKSKTITLGATDVKGKDGVEMYSMENCYQYWNGTFGNCVYRAMRHYELHEDDFTKRKAQGEDCSIEVAVGSLGFLLNDERNPQRVFWEYG